MASPRSLLWKKLESTELLKKLVDGVNARLGKSLDTEIADQLYALHRRDLPSGSWQYLHELVRDIRRDRKLGAGHGGHRWGFSEKTLAIIKGATEAALRLPEPAIDFSKLADKIKNESGEKSSTTAIHTRVQEFAAEMGHKKWIPAISRPRKDSATSMSSLRRVLDASLAAKGELKPDPRRFQLRGSKPFILRRR